MSRIDRLVEDLCRDGVPYVGITEVTDYIRGITYNKNDETAEGEVSVLRANNITLASNTLNFTDVKRVSGRVRVRENQHLRAGDILVCAGSGSKEHIGKAAYIDSDRNETFGGFMAVVRTKDPDLLEPRFVFHLLTGGTFSSYLRSALSTTTINNLNTGVMRGYRIPFPPLEVQREIVRVLDQFTQLEAELEAELKAELKARREQYAYYRDALVGAAGGHSTAMGEIGTFVRGRRFTKSDVVEEGIPSIHYGEIYTDYGVSASRANRNVRPDMAGHLRYAQPHDVIFAGVGETVEDVGKAVAWLGDGPVAVHDDTFSFTSNLDPKYVAYAVQTKEFHTQKANYVARGKVKRLSSAGLSRIMIPVPSVIEQKRIVSLLDSFDALVNDLSFGLPAELAARRKQYEYYRDTLLTFKEASV